MSKIPFNPPNRIRLVTKPTIFVMGEMRLDEDALLQLTEWLETADRDCLEGSDDELPFNRIFPHDGIEKTPDKLLPERDLTDNELLVELAGRGCYRSYGAKAGRKSNAEYVANLLGDPGKIAHASVLYHAKMTFFFAGISRRMTHELIRHYVGADRTEEGCPSQESTRFTHHPGHFAVHPRDEESPEELDYYQTAMELAYEQYHDYLRRQFAEHGGDPKGMERKRIYESAAMRLPGSACTSMYWTTNPEALSKLFRERCDNAADLEMQRFALKLRHLCFERWPNLFRASNLAWGNTK